MSQVKTLGYRFLGHLLGLSWDQPRCRAPPDSLLGSRTPPQSMMQCTRRPIGPHPLRSTPLFKWIHSPKKTARIWKEKKLLAKSAALKEEISCCEKEGAAEKKQKTRKQRREKAEGRERSCCWQPKLKQQHKF
ncbi:hypothetical protein M9H77_18621 [Catharanthus roseus]|uniref:Uncharacterized protein n=1 Tax=Catharanthus roseus TaxID=4058 RepID=A0ACC0B888_CATRO|nr:hypothetical protein M9H77_18621 [Catharanthus roseus]